MCLRTLRRDVEQEDETNMQRIPMSKGFTKTARSRVDGIGDSIRLGNKTTLRTNKTTYLGNKKTLGMNKTTLRMNKTT